MYLPDAHVFWPFLLLMFVWCGFFFFLWSRGPQIRQRICFPDRRLVQYDAGKLQVLAGLLRSRKQGGHKCLIFTQASFRRGGEGWRVLLAGVTGFGIEDPPCLKASAWHTAAVGVFTKACLLLVVVVSFPLVAVAG